MKTNPDQERLEQDAIWEMEDILPARLTLRGAQG